MAHKPAEALLGIATLSNPEYLIEVDAIAVVDEAPIRPNTRTVPAPPENTIRPEVN